MPEFKGIIGRTIAESTPWWPEPVRAREGAPNVLYVVLDDVGYGQLSPFGGLCEMPNLDRLAANGLRYTNFHTTALCSPTRTCLLTGRNHHSNGMATIVENASGFPGYNGEIPFENGFLSEMLTPLGYAAYAVGKWHLTPHSEMNMAARKDRWPLGRGFERFYGFMGGDTNQWNPDLVYDNHSIEQPRSVEEGYHLTEDLADRAIEFVTDLRNAAPDKPFFLYFCTGACHAPHHAPKEWIEKYRGTFDMGWDKARETILKRQKEMGIVPPNTDLTDRPDWIPPWDTLNEDEKRLYARMMEVFAGFASHTDHHIGRVLDFLDRNGLTRNTIVIYTSDQGFFLGDHGLFDKRFMYEESLRMPFLVRWPAAIKGGTRSDAIALNVDFAPTFLDAAGLPVPPEMQGRSLLPLWRGRTPDDWRTSMYYRYYHDPGDHNTRAHYGVRTRTHKLIHFWKKDQWELFDLVNDPFELHNLYGQPGQDKLTATLQAELLRLKKAVGDDDRLANEQLPNGVDGPVATLRGR
jgi:arylsulfatase A-like enzyme